MMESEHETNDTACSQIHGQIMLNFGLTFDFELAMSKIINKDTNLLWIMNKYITTITTYSI